MTVASIFLTIGNILCAVYGAYKLYGTDAALVVLNLCAVIVMMGVRR